jgi:hypothetical protein
MVSVKGRKDGMNLAVKHIPLKEGTDTQGVMVSFCRRLSVVFLSLCSSV